MNDVCLVLYGGGADMGVVGIYNRNIGGLTRKGKDGVCVCVCVCVEVERESLLAKKGNLSEEICWLFLVVHAKEAKQKQNTNFHYRESAAESKLRFPPPDAEKREQKCRPNL
jgi:hypothetical protein